MKTFRILLTLFVFPFFALAQVGIGTISPNAQLEISASSQTSPANNDGLLIPKIDEFPAIDPTAAQNGMMVFVTGSGSPAQGFYYWDNSTTSWQNINTGADSLNELSDGKSDADGTDDGASVFLGRNAGLNDDGSSNYNVGIGRSALSTNATGFWNTGVGYFSLLNSTGSFNTALGYSTLAQTTSGQGNTAVGTSALSFNQTGNSNIAIGNSAMQSNVSGDINVAIGNSAMVLNTTGEYNVAIGSSTMRNSNSNYNVGVGYRSMYNLTSGENNIALGYLSLNSTTTGQSNVAIGTGALNNNNTGGANVAVGRSAGATASGEGNTILGAYAKSAGSVGGDYNVFLGYSAGRFENGSNKLYIENTDSSSPLIYGEFDTNILRTNGTFQIGDPSGTGYALPTADGSANQVLQTDGSGNISWASQSVGVQSINDLTDGRSDDDGTDDGSSVFIGINSGANDDFTSNQNVGIGANALNSNTSGATNTAVGTESLRANTTGNGNSGLGHAAMIAVTTGSANSAIGNGALFSLVDGQNNTALGFGSLAFNVSGANNVGVGHYSGLYYTGSQNTILGANAGSGPSVPTVSGNVLIGFSAGYSNVQSNRLYIDNSATSRPLIYGEFDNDILRANGTLQVGDPSTSGFAFPITDGSANQVLQTDGSGNVSWVTASGTDNDWTVVGSNIERQAGNVYIGDDASTGNDLYINDRIVDWDDTAYYLNPDGLNRLDEVSLDAGSTADPSVTFGDSRTGFFSPGTNSLGITINNTERVRINSSGQVGINTTNPAYDLEVGGVVMLEDTTVPGHVAGHSGLFSRTGELYAIDSAGNLTVISPHHFELITPSDPMAWSFYSENIDQGRKINVDMLKVVRAVELLSGEQLVFTSDLDGNMIATDKETLSLKEQVEDQQKEIESLKAELNAIKALIDQKQ